ncbi:heme-binding protein, partial [Streptomyces sp. NPDC059352]
MKKASSRTRAVTGGALAAAIALGGFGAYSASATGEDPAAAPAAAAPKADAKKADAKNKNTTRSTHLTIEAATKAAQATLDAAEKENQRVSVAV